MSAPTLAYPAPRTVQAFSHEPPCRFCGTSLRHTFVDLGMSPLCQTHIGPHQLNQMEPFYPLHVFVCDRCFLVQLEQYVAPKDIFTEYAYFSSYSDSWVTHAKHYAEAMTDRFGLGPASKVMEIGSNDGYLLQHFLHKAIPVLGIEPAANVARAAIGNGIPTAVRFFGASSAYELVREHGQADLLLGNNVLAHVPDINDFVGGMKAQLKPGGVVTMEFPHLHRLMEETQYDTIYHEHFSYLSFTIVEQVFAAHGITLFDVEELPTHGGSLRIYGRHNEDIGKPVGPRVEALRVREHRDGVTRLEHYESFGQRVKESKRALLECLIAIKRAGKRIAGYGAPGKGNTLLNYCGIRSDFLEYTVDRNPYKQGKYTPGTHIPILPPEHIRETRPDYLLILPWNLTAEITQQCAFIREWGGKFIVPIPTAAIL